MTDNYRFDMTGVDLGTALSVAFGDHLKRKCIGYKTTERYIDPVTPSKFILFWADSEIQLTGMIPLPPMGPFETEIVVNAWLASADYGREPDHDGSNTKGCRVYNDTWGHAAGYWQAFAVIEPAWLMHGK